MNDRSEQPLEPAKFDPREPSVSIEGNSSAGKSPRFVMIVGAACVVLLFVVFVLLPGWVDSTDTPAGVASTERPDSPNAVPAAATPKRNEATESVRSPFAEAQESKARRAAQESLQLILELQETLEARDVTLWADTEYQAALGVAETGDQAYREREFDAALAAYDSASDALIALETSIPRRILDAATATAEAVDAGDEPAALNSLTILKTLDPGAATTAALETRVAAIKPVQESISSAETLADREQYTAAIEAIEAALRLDADNIPAQERLAVLQEAAQNARFLQAMSDGYLALEESRFGDARRLFNDARNTRKSAPEPGAALLELESAETAAQLRRLQREGLAQEANEQWSAAVKTYQEALAIDTSVVFASDGLKRSEPRAELSKALEGVITERERLVDRSILEKAEQTLQQANAIKEPGAKLSRQIAEVSAILDYARTPVDMAFVSDGQTDVTVLRVKRLGSFLETQLTLRPGKYTAVGIRNGYRDVRINFEATPDQADGPIAVRCTEAI